MIDNYCKTLKLWNGFSMLCGAKSAVYTHICRTVCRLCERSIWKFAKDVYIPNYVAQYVNRLSDYFYALGRRINGDKGNDEVLVKDVIH
ncbi:MAG: hypothetical protein HUJ97_05615 [Bacteroidales bacterium]|nr:hypothetical protein [Bacteroidales bacterium]